jgi:hypothetical protein
MDSLYEYIIVIIGIFAALSCMVYVRETRRMFVFMHEKQPELWKNIGAPAMRGSFLATAAVAFSPAVVSYLVAKRYMEADPELQKQGKKVQQCLAVTACAGLALILAVIPKFVMLLAHGGPQIFKLPIPAPSASAPAIP